MQTARELIQAELDRSEKNHAQAVEAQNLPLAEFYYYRADALKFALDALDLEDACK